MAYTLSEFHARFLSDPCFLRLHQAWVDSGYQFWERPSADRIDPMKPYTLDNLQMVTWRENRRKADHELVRTRATAVVQMDMDGTVLATFPSVKEAEAKTGTRTSGIVACCRGKRRHARGYRWRYAGTQFRTVRQRETLMHAP